MPPELKYRLSLDSTGALAGLQRFNQGLARISPALRTVGMGATAFGGAIVGALALSVRAANENAVALTKLRTMIQGVGTAMDVQPFIDQALALQKVTTFSDETTMAMQTMLVGMRLTQNQVLALTPVIQDLAMVYGDAESIAKQLGKALATGNFGALARYGVLVSDTAKKSGDFNLILEEITKNAGKQAEAVGKTLPGQLAIAKNMLDEVAETIGNALVPQLKSITSSLVPLLVKLQELAASEAGQKMIVFGAALGTASLLIGPFLIALSLLSGAITALLTPVGLIIAGIAAIGIVIGAVEVNSLIGKFRNASTAADGANQVFQSLIGTVAKLAAVFSVMKDLLQLTPAALAGHVVAATGIGIRGLRDAISATRFGGIRAGIESWRETADQMKYQFRGGAQAVDDILSGLNATVGKRATEIAASIAGIDVGGILKSSFGKPESYLPKTKDMEDAGGAAGKAAGKGVSEELKKAEPQIREALRGAFGLLDPTWTEQLYKPFMLPKGGAKIPVEKLQDTLRQVIGEFERMAEKGVAFTQPMVDSFVALLRTSAELEGNISGVAYAQEHVNEAIKKGTEEFKALVKQQGESAKSFAEQRRATDLNLRMMAFEASLAVKELIKQQGESAKLFAEQRKQTELNVRMIPFLFQATPTIEQRAAEAGMGRQTWWQEEQAQAPEAASERYLKLRRLGIPSETAMQIDELYPDMAERLTAGMDKGFDDFLEDMPDKVAQAHTRGLVEAAESKEWLATIQNNMADTMRSSLTDAIVRGGNIFQALGTSLKASLTGAFAEGLMGKEGKRTALWKFFEDLAKPLTSLGTSLGNAVGNAIGSGKWMDSAGKKVGNWLENSLKRGGIWAAAALASAFQVLTRKGPKTLGTFIQAGLTGFQLGGPWGAVAGVGYEAARSRAEAGAQFTPGPILQPPETTRIFTPGPVLQPTPSSRLAQRALQPAFAGAPSVTQYNYFAYDGDPVRAAYAIASEMERKSW